MLDEELDFIGKFENLDEDVKLIKEKLNIKQELPDSQTSKTRKEFHTYFNERDKSLVYNMYKKDIEYFNYSFQAEIQ